MTYIFFKKIIKNYYQNMIVLSHSKSHGDAATMPFKYTHYGFSVCFLSHKKNIKSNTKLTICFQQIGGSLYVGSLSYFSLSLPSVFLSSTSLSDGLSDLMMLCCQLELILKSLFSLCFHCMLCNARSPFIASFDFSSRLPLFLFLLSFRRYIFHLTNVVSWSVTLLNG